jgi:hypothetical protein
MGFDFRRSGPGIDRVGEVCKEYSGGTTENETGIFYFHCYINEHNKCIYLANEETNAFPS